MFIYFPSALDEASMMMVSNPKAYLIHYTKYHFQPLLPILALIDEKLNTAHTLILTCYQTQQPCLVAVIDSSVNGGFSLMDGTL